MTLDFLQALRSGVSWIHPSYRDLVIDELSRDESLRLKFLGLMDLEGVKLAVSQAGGAKGQRQMPFMTSGQDWSVLGKRCVELAGALDNDDLVNLLDVLKSATVDLRESDRLKLIGVLTAVCETARQRWDRQKTVLKPEQLREFFEATILIDPLPILPALGPTWKSAESAARSAIQSAASGSELLDGEALLEWAQLSSLLSSNEPRFLKQVGFPQLFAGLIVEIVTIISQEVRFAPPDDADDIFQEAERLELLYDALTILKRLFPSESSRIEAMQLAVGAQEELLRDLYREDEREPDDYDVEPHASADRELPFDFESIFSDL